MTASGSGFWIRNLLSKYENADILRCGFGGCLDGGCNWVRILVVLPCKGEEELPPSGGLAEPLDSPSFSGKGISEQMQGSISLGITNSVLTFSLCQESELRRPLVSESKIPTTPLVVPTRIFLPAVTSVAT